MTHSQKLETKQTLEFEAIGTVWRIELFDCDQDITEIKQQILKRIDEFDSAYSRFRPDSLVTKMSQKPGTYTLPVDAKPMFDFYQKLYFVTQGFVTPLIGNLLQDAGYDAEYSLKPKKLRKVIKWDDALDYSYPKLTIKKPVILDFGAAGKGYLVDIISVLLDGLGLHKYYVNAGGDLYCKSQTDVEIALQHPEDITLAIGTVQLKNAALCGSAPNIRSWMNFNHIMNPVTRVSVSNLKAVWVVADSAIIADALTTALFFTAPEVLKRHFKFEYALVDHEDSLVYSKNFPAQFFTDTVSS